MVDSSSDEAPSHASEETGGPFRASRKASKHASFPRTSNPRSMPSVPGFAQARATQVRHSAAPSSRLIPMYAIANFIEASTPFNAQFSATKRGAESILSRFGGGPASNDSVAKLPRLPHATRRLSHGHVDGVTAVWHRVDAVGAKLKFGKGWKSR